MAFENIHYLWLLFLAPVLCLVSIYSHRKSSRWLFSFSREKKRLGVYLLNLFLLASALILVIISLAGPKIQFHKTYFNRGGIVVTIGIDVSKSMLAEDVAFPPESEGLFSVSHRLNRARYFALELLSLLHGERVGLFMFANQAIEIVPLTRDYGYYRYVLTHINDATISVPGSNLGEAIMAGTTMLNASREKGAKIMILLSDGEDISLDKSPLYESAQQAAEQKVRIYTVGIGTSQQVLIPIRSADESFIAGYYLDEDGSYLKSSLVPDTLKQIAATTGGRYYRVNEERAPEQLLDAILQEAKDLEETKSVELAWLDLSAFFLGAGLVCFATGGLFSRC